MVFVVKPFGGSTADAAASAAAARSRRPARCRSTRRRGRACFIDETPQAAPRRCASIVGRASTASASKSDGGLAKTIEINVVAGKEIAQLVELTKSPSDRAADRAAAAAAAAARRAAPAPPTPGFMTVDAPEELTIVEDGRMLGIVGRPARSRSIRAAT